ncbi:MAG: hypothetical protein Q8Q59_10210 [Luteolibacter sp.]|jgi:hypothetical protein|nr:hypothetical protein [Luteolibacter sp.]
MRSSIFLAGFIILTAASCKQDKEIKVYRIAREAPAEPATTANPHAGMPPAAAVPGTPDGDPHAGMTADQLSALGALGGGPSATDSPPEGWKKQAASAMRQLSYLVEGGDGAAGDVSLIILGGNAGSDLDNTNRWRAQLGLPPVDEAAFRQSAETLVTQLGSALLVDLEGLPEGGDAKKDGRILGVISHTNDSIWFFKMRGNAALTAAQKSNFIQWVQSAKPAAPGKVPMHGTPPGEDFTPPSASSTPAADGPVTWQLPDRWTVGVGSAARYATIAVTGTDGSKGELAVTHFPGDVGGDLANVNRWRGQIGLEPIDETALATTVSEVTAGPRTLKVIDATGAQSRCAAGWILHAGETWFFKFTGPDALVAAEKTKFMTFLKSIRFNTTE